jgi:large subunit ribosomal protein L3
VRGLIGKKVGMTQVFGDDGELVPVTVVEAGPCTVVQVRTREKDGYEALQLGMGTRREKRLSKAARGHMAKAGRSTFARLIEVPVDDASAFAVGQELKAGEVFTAGDVVDVTGVSKGRGFSGVMRRHHFGGHRKTHGTHESFRGPGSVGAGTYPAHIWKGKRMPGQMGAKRRTVQNLRIVDVRADENLIFVGGGIPGPRGGDVVIRAAVKGAEQ